MAVVLVAIFASVRTVDSAGVLYAIASGALTSGIGYAIWYTALRGLRATNAATVQLSVPVIAALGGVALLAEPLTLRLIGSGAAILGGVALVVFAPKPSQVVE
jgi:drug/metabolite transporter (DMT)-like permease